ncbi:MAG: proton-conducting transporter membrane subunit, partial [Sphingomonadales bacterium]
LYDRIHSREIARYGGLVHRMPRYALVFMVFTLAAVALPGTSGFVGEFLILAGAYKVATWVALGAATGMVLGAAYMLWLYRRVVFGELVKEDLKAITDLSRREVWLFSPLVAIVIWMGVYPASFSDFLTVSVENLLMQHEAAISAATGVADSAGDALNVDDNATENGQ